MSFQISPGVTVKEQDLTSIVPNVATSPGAFAGVFAWGPIMDPITVTSETVLAQRFGAPKNTQTLFTSFFSAANFLAYANNLLVARVDGTDYKNACAGGFVDGVTVNVTGSGYTGTPIATFSAPQTAGGTTATGTVVKTGSTVTSVIVTNGGSGYTSAPTVTISGGSGSGATATATIVSLSATKVKNADDYQANVETGSNSQGPFIAKFAGTLGNSIKVSMADSAAWSTWTYKNEFNAAPDTTDFADAAGGSNDELHIVVVDNDGKWSGVAGTVLEKFAFVSKASDAKKADGTNNYYKNVLNGSSKYIWWADHPTISTNWGDEALNTTFGDMAGALTVVLVGGADDFAPTDGAIETSYDLFANAERYDVSLLITGMVSSDVANYIIENVAEVRKDCIVFISPLDPDGNVIIGSGSDPADDVVAFRNELTSSSYAVIDSGFKYQYDRYNDSYHYVPLNGDVAGLCARTDAVTDPWFSPGGFNRGQIKNVVKLAFNPGQTERDTLYKNGVNPVVAFPGQGTVLYGDKTLLAKPSAFDRINVRRLFIVLEKAISTAAKFQLFEFNDSFTRAQFKNIVEPFLRDVQGRRGITDFVVKCDESNNTGEVIDANEFVASIFVKPSKSINYINLTFVAARSSVSFSEIGG